MKTTDLERVERTTGRGLVDVWRIGAAGLFVVGVMVFTGARFGSLDQAYLLIAAAVIGAYLAMNIGANDVANNVGPAVGSFAMTMTTAIIIAAIFEAAGAIIAGGNVVNTVKSGIIDPADIGDPQVFVWVMMGALLGAAIWLNVATWAGAPVSTTHSIVGGVLGCGIVASGWAAVNWPAMGAIVSSWVISPVAGGAIAAGLLYCLKRFVFWTADPTVAAVRVVPLMLFLMGWTFTTYLMLKGVQNIVVVSAPVAMAVGLVVGGILYAVMRLRIAARAARLVPGRAGVNQLFTVPLIFAAALLSFAHGANDVANAIGPLAGIVEVLVDGDTVIGASAAIPLWVLVIGALGISVGLAIFGPRLIRTVGSEITELDRSRAFCIAMSAGLTVIVASQLGMPISTTHVALGGIFGIGFLREFLDGRMNSVVQDVIRQHDGEEHIAEVEKVLFQFKSAPIEEKQRILAHLDELGRDAVITAGQQRRLKKVLRRQLVKRSHLLKIVSAWVITVPASALLSIACFLTLRLLLG